MSQADAAHEGPQPAHDGVAGGSYDPAVDAMVKPTPGYPDILVAPPGEHPAQDDARSPRWAQHGDRLTTGYGVRVDDTDNTLRAGPRGPSLLEDPHAREKISHFDHERIPERVVHARGTAAHGHFRPYESQASITAAAFLADPDVVTPVFVRFSTVLGSKGAPTPAREVRGFATKFYTSEGNFDLVGNNMPVFFIRDGIKFPDLIHAAKPEHHREIPQAATAHDTFWDFISLLPESTHHVMWSMSDRSLPRSYRMMQGFGVHTFRLIDAEGATTLVKFHWKPLLGTHSMLWEETQKLGGVDPDWHHRDLYDAIESGAFPEWELGLQLFEDTDDQTFEGIDLLDSTKYVPEELCPVVPVGRLVLDRNVTDAFAETEQVAYCTSHLVPGIDVTDDPLLMARNFSYQDTQLTRLGGPNFEFLPINRSRASVNANLLDGFGQAAILQGRAFYSPNSLGGGCPMTSSIAEGGYTHAPRAVAPAVVGRQRSEPMPDDFSQATMFWESMSAVEKDHIVSAFSFELGKVELVHIRERMLRNLAEVDATLTALVAVNLGLSVPPPSGPATDGSATAPAFVSPALSQLPVEAGPIDGRVVAVLAGDGADGAAVRALAAVLTAARARALLVAPHVGLVIADDGSALPAAKSFLTSQSVEYDAVVVAGGSAATLLADPVAAMFVQEAYRHAKPIGTWADGIDAIGRLGLDIAAPGMVAAPVADQSFNEQICTSMGWHRFWDRLPAMLAVSGARG